MRGAMPTIDVVREPAGEAYQALITSVASLASTFSVVIRPELGISPACLALLEKLAPFLIRAGERRVWPGTELIGGTAEVREYALSPQAIELLTSEITRLYGWQQPDAPEDPCLYRADGRPVLVTISHEADAFLEVSSDELALIVSWSPELRACLAL